MFVRRPRHSAYSVESPYVWVKRGVLGLAFVSFAGVVWYAASNRDSLETENLNPPLVQAPVTPIKERATEPGGMVIPNQDKEVFNLLDATSEENAATPDINGAIETSMNKEEVVDTLAEVAPEKTQEVLTKAAEKVEEVKETVKEAAKSVKMEPAPTNPLPEKVDSFTSKIVADRQKQAAKEEAAITAPKEASKGDWAVQLASYTAEDSALKGVKIFQERYPDLLAGLTPIVKRVELAKGVYHRVYFTGIASKTASADLCAKFKQKNQACLNVKQ